MSKQPNHQKPTSPPSAPAVRLGRVTITGDSLRIDDDLAEAAVRAASTRTFHEQVLASMLLIDDITKAQGRAGAYLQQCLAAGDVAGTERWASLGLALDEVAQRAGENIERYWPPQVGGVQLEQPPALTDDELAAEAEAAAELEQARAAVVGNRNVLDDLELQLEQPPMIGGGS